MPPIRSAGGRRQSRAGSRDRDLDQNEAPREIAVVGAGKVEIAMAAAFFIALAVIFYALWQIIAGERAAPPIRPAELKIPAGAIEFASIDDFAAGYKSKAGSPFVFVIKEEDLAAKIRAEVGKRSDIPLKDPSVRIENEHILLSGGFTIAAGFSAPATIRIRPTAAAGRLTYEIPSIDLGPIPVPGAARDAIADTIDRQLTAARIGDLMFVEGVRTLPGSVTLVGRLK